MEVWISQILAGGGFKSKSKDNEPHGSSSSLVCMTYYFIAYLLERGIIFFHELFHEKHENVSSFIIALRI